MQSTHIAVQGGGHHGHLFLHQQLDESKVSGMWGMISGGEVRSLVSSGVGLNDL